GEIDVLPLFERGKHIDPQFSSDGASLYFIAEPDGVPDVFRYDLGSGRTERITALEIGVSGITATSPALTVADGILAFSVIEDGNYHVYRMALPDAQPIDDRPGFAAAVLPPPDASPGLVDRYLADPDTGLPPRSA